LRWEKEQCGQSNVTTGIKDVSGINIPWQIVFTSFPEQQQPLDVCAVRGLTTIGDAMFLPAQKLTGSIVAQAQGELNVARTSQSF
jgi:hypothetical protein